MIDVNKTYRTRDGHDVTKLTFFSKEKFLFKHDSFFGQLVTKNGECPTFVEWDQDGKAFGKDYLDLIEVEDDQQR